ncbi:hypothetical protein Ddc_14325 [Ditylenchus destructor]|nr:hypothetical protein Ddc_14325 [Ditylenchus destructor]
MAEVNGERIVTLVEDWVAETLKSAVRDITGDAQLDPKLKAVPLDVPLFEHYCPQHRINPQMDGVNCGFHIALIAEAFLMNNGEVFLENFDIATERTRILDILSGLRNDNYRYNPRDVCYAPKDVDLDLEMKQLDNAMNAKGKVLDSFEYATIENECVEKSATKDEEKAPDNVPEKMSQLVESAESNTLENDRSKARNERQSASPAPDSEEAASKPDQEMEKTEVTTLPDAVGLQQHICKGTEDPEKPNLETTVQLKTKNVANENKRDGTKVNVSTKSLLFRKISSENDRSKARNERQSASPASSLFDADGEEAASKPDQEIEKTEVTTLPDAVGLQQHICKGTEDPEKPNLETTVQLKTKDDAEKVANENKRDGTKASEAGCRSQKLSFENVFGISIAPMAPLSSSQAENSDQRSEPAKMPASSQETLNIKENITPEADDANRTPNFSESKISPKVNVKENVALKSDVVPYITRQFLQNFHEVKVNANRTFPFSTYHHTPSVPTEQSSIFQEPKVPDSIRKRAKSIKKIATPVSLKKHCWSLSSRDILESLKASNLPKAESDSRVKNLASLQQEKFLQKSPFSSANKSRSPSIFHNDEDLLPSDLDENLSMQSR